MIQAISSFSNKHHLISQDATIILGLSGGPDSMFLLHFLCDLRDTGVIKKLIAAHLDHGWRADSHNDVEFCKTAAQKLNVPLVSAHLADIAQSLKYEGSQEELGRRARRIFFKKVMQDYHADAIALAHHLQDQEETFFIRLIRGTSLTGLCAMWPKRGPYIRPLLETNKKDIVQYLDQNNIAYLVDPSNESPAMLRNRVRNTVLPALQACDARFNNNFLATLNRLQSIEQYLDTHTAQLLKIICHEKNDAMVLDIQKLSAQPTIMQYRLLMQWLCAAHVSFPSTQQFLDEIIRFFQQPESKDHAIHQQWKLVKKKQMAWIVSR